MNEPFYNISTKDRQEKSFSIVICQQHEKGEDEKAMKFVVRGLFYCCSSLFTFTLINQDIGALHLLQKPTRTPPAWIYISRHTRNMNKLGKNLHFFLFGFIYCMYIYTYYTYTYLCVCSYQYTPTWIIILVINFNKFKKNDWLVVIALRKGTHTFNEIQTC